MKNLRLVYFNLAFIFMGGGDKRFIEIAKRLIKKKHQVMVITSRSGYLNSQREGLRVDFRIVPLAISDRLGIVVSYLLRTLFAFFLVPKFKKTLLPILPLIIFPMSSQPYLPSGLIRVQDGW